ncbi:MAG: hypothetical protein JST86_15090 [Bacteroidetes bacterium]|nr:hypothetical protein [Bacteroidota bacterium]
MLPIAGGICISACNDHSNATSKSSTTSKDTTAAKATAPPVTKIDAADFAKRLLANSNHDTTGKWPAQMPTPLDGALLPYNRIVAFYGNMYSKKMGILGEIPKDSMLAKLKEELAKWQAADPQMPTIPALHYIAVTAQGAAGKDGKHRFRMPFHQIDTIMNWAKEINAQVFLDIQVGHSLVKDEAPLLEPYLKLPNVHLGIDPEFSMKHGETPGSKIGTMSYEDINDAVDLLADIVRKNHLAPKILIVHRFTQGMVTGYDKIKKVPEVQIVMDMDGFGDKYLKRSTYLRYIYKEPVEFTGFKLFYKNDTKPGTAGMFTPGELLKFVPQPLYIQYQ